MKKKCRYCDEPSLPGLNISPGLCKYHWMVYNWGKEWADKVQDEMNDIIKEKEGEL